jgi:hypothetical protein
MVWMILLKQGSIIHSIQGVKGKLPTEIGDNSRVTNKLFTLFTTISKKEPATCMPVLFIHS